MMNFLEQVIAEWFSHKGYFVKTNIKFGKLPRGALLEKWMSGHFILKRENSST